MRIAITGSEGMLGRTLQKTLSSHELFPLSKQRCDITNPKVVHSVLSDLRPDVVIHCAAMTKVDKCEVEQHKAWLVNTFGTSNIASASNRIGARLVTISTDYVFDGNLDRPYHEFDVPEGKSCLYGMTKRVAEDVVRTHCPNHVILRTAWLYGERGPSFVHTMLKLAEPEDLPIKVVNDQLGNPTSTLVLSNIVKSLLDYPEIVGTIHASCEGEASWYDFAKEIFCILKLKKRVQPCSSSEYPTLAKRPKNSRLEKMILHELGIIEIPDWRDALRTFLLDHKSCV